jgi:hypothetical protein
VRERASIFTRSFIRNSSSFRSGAFVQFPESLLPDEQPRILVKIYENGGSNKKISSVCSQISKRLSNMQVGLRVFDLMVTPLTDIRIRHIRCDEARPACANCLSTGRKCDGFNLFLQPVAQFSHFKPDQNDQNYQNLLNIEKLRTMRAKQSRKSAPKSRNGCRTCKDVAVFLTRRFRCTNSTVGYDTSSVMKHALFVRGVSLPIENVPALRVLSQLAVAHRIKETTAVGPLRHHVRNLLCPLWRVSSSTSKQPLENYARISSVRVLV